jgi:hypothetical protein
MRASVKRTIVIFGCLALGLGLMGPLDSAKAERQRYEIDTVHSGVDRSVSCTSE